MSNSLCHSIYDPCVVSNYVHTCVCDKDKVRLLNGIYQELERIYSSHRDRILKLLTKYGNRLCMLKKVIIDEIGGIVKCFLGDVDDDFLKRYCPSHIICDEEYIEELYRENGFIHRNPDVLIIKGRTVTIIVEEKEYGKQSFQRFFEQITGEYEYLPRELRSRCTFIVYAPQSGHALPRGLKRDSRYGLLVYDRPIRKDVINLFDVPVFMYPRNLLSYL